MYKNLTVRKAAWNEVHISHVARRAEKMAYSTFVTSDQLARWNDEKEEFAPVTCYIRDDDHRELGIAKYETWNVNPEGTEAVAVLSTIAVWEEHQKNDLGSKLLLESLEEVKKHWESYGYKLVGCTFSVHTGDAASFFNKVLMGQSTFHWEKRVIYFGNMTEANYWLYFS